MFRVVNIMYFNNGTIRKEDDTAIRNAYPGYK